MELDPVDAASRVRPARFWFGTSLSDLTLVRSRSDQQLRVGDKVHLKSAPNIPTTSHGGDGEPTGRIIVDTLLVKETCTIVGVLWQDGTRETVKSTELVPY